MTVKDLMKVYFGDVEFYIKGEIEGDYPILYKGKSSDKQIKDFQFYDVLDVVVDKNGLAIQVDMDEEDFYEIKKMKVEKGHTIEEYMAKYGEDYENRNLWGILKKELEGGTLEVNENMTYWLIGDKYYETQE